MKYRLILILGFLIGCKPKTSTLPEAISNAVMSESDLQGEADSASALWTKKVWDALGGKQRFDETRYISFDFSVVSNGKEVSKHRHVWDKHRNRYRVEGKNRAGEVYSVVFSDLNEKKGAAWVNGQIQSGDALKKQLDYGYGRYINDTYWLIMPWKWRDDGVRLRYDGTQKDSITGKTLQTLHLSFTQVGLTPGDQYWVMIDPVTSRMESWKFLLQGPDAEKGHYLWQDWVSVNGISFSTTKTSGDGKRKILTDNIRTYEVMSDSVFLSPEYMISTRD